MNYLITGATGFVGTHFIRDLKSRGHTIHGIGTHVPSPSGELAGIGFHSMSLMDYKSLHTLLKDIQPDQIVHLASASSVAASWESPNACFVNNTNIFLNLVEAVRELKLRCRVLSVGSSEEYGVLTEKDVPIREDHSLAPASPYAVARVAQEQLSQVYSRGYGLDIVCTRSFNHIGPGQSERFVVSSFVKQAVAVSRKQQKEIFVGRIDIVRDFIDVRDVIQAYAVILEKGKPGQVYNVCTGKGHSLQDVLEHICRRLDIPMAAKTKDALLRPVENRMIVGENAQLRALGFQPQYDLSKSLDDMIAWWQNQISA